MRTAEEVFSLVMELASIYPGSAREVETRIAELSIRDELDIERVSVQPLGGDPEARQFEVFVRMYEGERTRFTVERQAVVLAGLRNELQAWANLQGHARCHWHPEILLKLCDIAGVKPTVPIVMPTEAEFEAGCNRYRAEEYQLTKARRELQLAYDRR